eukprot:3886157-Amphidinium_carterae.2
MQITEKKLKFCGMRLDSEAKRVQLSTVGITARPAYSCKAPLFLHEAISLCTVCRMLDKGQQFHFEAMKNRTSAMTCRRRLSTSCGKCSWPQLSRKKHGKTAVKAKT